MLTVVKNCVIVENVKNLINMFTDKCDGVFWVALA